MSFSSMTYGVIGCFIGLIIGYFVSKKNNQYKALYDNLLSEIENKNNIISDMSQSIARKQVTIEYLETEKQSLEKYKQVSQEKIIGLNNNNTHLEAQKEFYEKQRNNDLNEIDTLKQKLNKIIQDKDDLMHTKNDIENKLHGIFTENTHLNQRIDMQSQEFARLQKQSEQTFENLAHKIFNEKSQSFTQKSEKTLTDVLNPVKESLNIFQNLVSEKFNIQDKEQGILKAELKRIIDINEKMTFQAHNLTKALKGDNKIMGNWGEMLLERILEDSGLSKNIDYVLQATNYDLKDTEGKRQIPDAIVKLPDNKEIIIDAKVSLLDYERIINDPEQQVLHEKSLLKSVRNHIDTLSAKKYYDNEKLLSPDFVLMFMPVEGAYNLAMQLDHQLHNYAWDKRIALVSNTTLFATLRTVASLWRIEKQNKNAAEIARRAGQLYDKFYSFTKDMENIEKRLDQTRDVFDDAFKKLSKGNGNLIRQTEHLKELGAKTNKSISIDTNEEDEIKVTHTPELMIDI